MMGTPRKIDAAILEKAVEMSDLHQYTFSVFIPGVTE